MPMTEKLQQLLNDPNATGAQVADLLKRDGINCRDSVSFDTPLIVAARSNNNSIIQYILNSAKSPAEKLNIINTANNYDETALSIALKVNNNKKIALLLIQNGADLSKGLSAETLSWLQPFIDYQQLKDLKKLDKDKLARRAASESAIGGYYYHELGDVQEALKWLELSAQDGNQQGMFSLATIYQNEVGDYTKAIYWYRHSYPMLTEQKQRDAVITQLKEMTALPDEMTDAIYASNMALGYIFSLQGAISLALENFKRAEELYQSVTEKNESDETLFIACSLWNGTSYDKQIPAMDYLDITKRFDWLVQANTEEALAMFIGMASLKDSPILQIVAYQLGKEKNLLNASQQSPLDVVENQPYVQALSVMYGWNGQAKNSLRAAGFFRKLAEANKNKNIELAAECYLMMAFAYFQQEKERDIYVSEAFQSLDDAHACLASVNALKRREIILTIVDGASFVTEDILQSYVDALMSCYSRETELVNIENMSLIANRIISISDYLLPYIDSMTDTMVNCYRNQKDSTIRNAIVELLNQLKEMIPADSEQHLTLEKALAECTQSNIEEKDYSLQQLDVAIDSYKTLASHGEQQESGGFQEKYTDTLMLRAEAHLNQRQFDEALKDFTEVYEASGLIDALTKMAHIETELGYYDEAIAHYRTFSEIIEDQNEKSVQLAALRDLKRIYEELIERDRRREQILDITKNILTAALSGDVNYIDTFEKLAEFEEFCQVVKDDPEIANKLLEIKERITPQELQRMAKQKEEEERARFQRLLESPGRSSEHRMATLLSLADTEKDNEERMRLIRSAINRWIESIVKIDQGRISLKNEASLVKMAKLGYLLASYYLAKFHEQNGNALGGLSLYARIAMSPEFDDNDNKIKNQAQRCIESYKRAEEGGISKIFSKQQKTSDYAADLLEVLKTPVAFEDPDIAIQSGLHENASSIDSYNNYNLTISQILGSKEDMA